MAARPACSTFDLSTNDRMQPLVLAVRQWVARRRRTVPPEPGSLRSPRWLRPWSSSITISDNVSSARPSRWHCVAEVASMSTRICSACLTTISLRIPPGTNSATSACRRQHEHRDRRVVGHERLASDVERVIGHWTHIVAPEVDCPARSSAVRHFAAHRPERQIGARCLGVDRLGGRDGNRPEHVRNGSRPEAAPDPIRRAGLDGWLPLFQAPDAAELAWCRPSTSTELSHYWPAAGGDGRGRGRARRSTDRNAAGSATPCRRRTMAVSDGRP
jgi:hypothetical protein